VDRKKDNCFRVGFELRVDLIVLCESDSRKLRGRGSNDFRTESSWRLYMNSCNIPKAEGEVTDIGRMGSTKWDDEVPTGGEGKGSEQKEASTTE